MIALVDKGHLLLLLAFYGSVASFIIHLGLSVYSIATSQSHALEAAGKPLARLYARLDRNLDYSRMRRIVRTRRTAASSTRLAKTIYVVGVSAVLLVVGGIVAFQNWEYIQRLRAVGDILDGLVIFIIVLVGIGAAIWSMPNSLFVLRSRLFGYLAAFTGFAALAASYQLGAYWVRYLQEMGPRVVLYVEGRSEPVSASIAFAANDGLIFFVDGTDYPVQYPWGSIVRIDGPPIPPTSYLFSQN
jgi:hypothetical protein